MALIEWIQWEERAVGQNHATLEDVVNRPLRQFLAAIGIPPDSDITGASIPAPGAVPWATITGTPTTLGGYGIADAYTKAVIDAALALLAPLASPVFTGTPEAPTQAPLDNSTKVATTAYTDAAVAAGGGGGGGGSFRDEIRLYRSTTAGFSGLGCAAPSGQGTASAPAFAGTNVLTRQLRVLYTGTTTANQRAGLRMASQVPINPAASFEMHFTFAQESNISGGRAFIGLCAHPTPLLLSWPNFNQHGIGLAYDEADLSSGNWFLFHDAASGTTTQIDTGVARDATSLYQLVITTTDGTSYDVELLNLSTGASVYSVTVNSNVPTNPMAVTMEIMNQVGVGGTAPLFSVVNVRGFLGPVIP